MGVQTYIPHRCHRYELLLWMMVTWSMSALPLPVVDVSRLDRYDLIHTAKLLTKILRTKIL